MGQVFPFGKTVSVKWPWVGTCDEGLEDQETLDAFPRLPGAHVAVCQVQPGGDYSEGHSSSLLLDQPNSYRGNSRLAAVSLRKGTCEQKTMLVPKRIERELEGMEILQMKDLPETVSLLMTVVMK